MALPRWSLALACLLTLLSLVPGEALASAVGAPRLDASQATLTVLAPSVTVINGSTGSRHEGRSGETLGAGDRVITGPTGGAIISFFDGSEQELDSDTEVLLKALGQTSGGGTLTAIAQAGGVTINRVAELSSNSSYQLETPTATAFVRGTIFRVAVERSPEGEVEDVVIASDDGEVEVQTPRERRRLRSGERLRVRRGARGGLEHLEGEGTVQEEQGTISTRRQPGTPAPVPSETPLPSETPTTTPSVPTLPPLSGGSGNIQVSLSPDAQQTSAGDCSVEAACYFSATGRAQGSVGGVQFDGIYTLTFYLAGSGDRRGLVPESSLLVLQTGEPRFRPDGTPETDYGVLVFRLSADSGAFEQVGATPQAWHGRGAWTAEGAVVQAGTLCAHQAVGSGTFEAVMRGEPATPAEIQISLDGDVSFGGCNEPPPGGSVAPSLALPVAPTALGARPGARA